MSSTSGQLPELELTWDARNDETEPKTSPEELLAAAHASCFAMQLAHGLIGAGWDPEVITVNAKVSFEIGIGITGIDARRAGRVRGHPGRAAPRDRRAREGDVPRLEGARRRRDHARAARPPPPRTRTRRSSPRARSSRPSTRTKSADFRRGDRRACRVRRSPQPLRLSRHVRRSRRPSRSSSAPTSRRRSGSPIPPSTTTTARRRRSAGASRSSRPPYKLAQAWRQARADLDAARGDAELAEMVPDYEADVARLEEELKLALVERDPADEKDVIVEVRQGVGGDEAALWAADVARMLQRYAERRKFKWEELEVSPSEGGGIKEGDVRGEGRRRLLGLQVRGRHAPRAARARHRVAGPHPHLDRDGRGDARGRGGRRRRSTRRI